MVLKEINKRCLPLHDWVHDMLETVKHDVGGMAGETCGGLLGLNTPRQTAVCHATQTHI